MRYLAGDSARLTTAPCLATCPTPPPRPSSAVTSTTPVPTAALCSAMTPRVSPALCHARQISVHSLSPVICHLFQEAFPVLLSSGWLWDRPPLLLLIGLCVNRYLDWEFPGEQGQVSLAFSGPLF